MLLFTDRHKEEVAAEAPGDVAEVVLSSLVVRRPRQFGACWLGCKLWEELELGEFWQRALGEEVGSVAWGKGGGASGCQSAHCATKRVIDSRKVVCSDGHGGLAGQ